MTMGPEIFAWIGEAGLISGSPEKQVLVGSGQKGQDGSAGSGAASLRGHFDLDLHLGLVPCVRNPSLYQGVRCVTSEDAGAAEPHRRTKMSRTIMTLSMIRRMVVTMLRRREGAASRVTGRFSGMMMRASGRLRHGVRRLPGSRCLDFQHRCPGRHDHAPGAIERTFG